MSDTVILPFHLRQTLKQISVKFQTIQDSNPGLTWQSHDGLIGVSPSTDPDHPSFLKDQQNILFDHQIVSMFISDVPGNKSHIKFGGWDKNGLAPNADLTLFHTISPESLAVNFTRVRFGSWFISDFNRGRSVLFDPSVQNIYLSETEFAILAGQINAYLDSQIQGYRVCDYTETKTASGTVTEFLGYCYFR